MSVIHITDINAPELAIYTRLTESQLRSEAYMHEGGLFIAESPKVINVALDAGYRPHSILCEERHITGDAADIIHRCGDINVYTGERKLLEQLTGYQLTRGVLCAMYRPQSVEPTWIKSAHRIAILNGVVEATNIGAIFRSAAALGIDGIILTSNTCDPLNRRSVRVSMGSVFLIPWHHWQKDEQSLMAYLHEAGYKTIAMALTPESISLRDPLLHGENRLAIIMGTEGDGLPKNSIMEADYVVRIPMYHNVDSLNVAAASAVAFWELGKSAPHE